MSYVLYDENDYVGDVASNDGLREMREAVENKQKTYKSFHDFLNEGITFITEPLMVDITNFIRDEPKGEVRTTVSNLKKLLIDSSLVAVITSNIDETILT